MLSEELNAMYFAGGPPESRSGRPRRDHFAPERNFEEENRVVIGRISSEQEEHSEALKPRQGGPSLRSQLELAAATNTLPANLSSKFPGEARQTSVTRSRQIPTRALIPTRGLIPTRDLIPAKRELRLPTRLLSQTPITISSKPTSSQASQSTTRRSSQSHIRPLSQTPTIPSSQLPRRRTGQTPITISSLSTSPLSSLTNTRRSSSTPTRREIRIPTRLPSHNPAGQSSQRPSRLHSQTITRQSSRRPSQVPSQTFTKESSQAPMGRPDQAPLSRFFNTVMRREDGSDALASIRPAHDDSSLTQPLSQGHFSTQGLGRFGPHHQRDRKPSVSQLNPAAPSFIPNTSLPSNTGGNATMQQSFQEDQSSENQVNPFLDLTAFSRLEDDDLRRLRRPRNWQKVANDMLWHTADEIRQRWEELHPEWVTVQEPPRRLPTAAEVPWSTAEEQYLRSCKTVRKMTHDEISLSLGRSAADCESQWKRMDTDVARRDRPKTATWTLREDALLIKLYESGLSWINIVEKFPGKTFNMLSWRWYHHLQRYNPDSKKHRDDAQEREKKAERQKEKRRRRQREYRERQAHEMRERNKKSSERKKRRHRGRG